jgi:Fe-S cluster assembly iron-binding protein IscA
LALDEPKDAENVERIGELEFLIEKQVRPYVANQVLDFVKSWRGDGFAIRPAAGGCG